MGANNNTIDFLLRFDTDVSGLKNFNQNLQQMQREIDRTIKHYGETYNNMLNENRQNENNKEPIRHSQEQLQYQQKLRSEAVETSRVLTNLKSAFDLSYNAKLNTINLNEFNQQLAKSNTTFTDLKKNLGTSAFKQLGATLLSTNTQLKQTSHLLDEMVVSFSNTIKWGITSSIFNNIANSIQGAWGYAKKLDNSLNDIRIVTGKSGDEMERFAREANNAAMALGKSTTDYTEASLIYYQQGLSEADVQARTETTLKTANVTGQSTAAVSEQLTAVWNGYKVNSQEAELYIDKLAAVAADTASDLEELSTGMSKVASAANLMGVDIDQLSAQMATIISVTRQAPESVGTALKTIYARMGDIEAGLDTEVTLGEYTSRMAEMGINVLTANGELRDMGSVIEEIGSKWTFLSREQQIALSQIMAGTRQYNNLLALFDNWDNYTKTLQTSQNAFGTLQKQQDIYMESTAAHLEQLEAAWEKVYDAFFDNDSMNKLIDIGTVLTNVLGSFIDGIGGGFNVLLGSGATLLRFLKVKLAPELMAIKQQFATDNENNNILTNQFKILQEFERLGINAKMVSQDLLESLMGLKKQFLDLGEAVTAEEHNEVNYLLQVRARLEETKQALLERERAIDQLVFKISQTTEQRDTTPKSVGYRDIPINGDSSRIRREDIYDEQGQLFFLEELQRNFGVTAHTVEDFNNGMLVFTQAMENARQETEDIDEVFASTAELVNDLDREFQEVFSTLFDLSDTNLLDELLDEEDVDKYKQLIQSLQGDIDPETGAVGNILSNSYADLLAAPPEIQQQAQRAFLARQDQIRQLTALYEKATRNVRKVVKDNSTFIRETSKNDKEKVEADIKRVTDVAKVKLSELTKKANIIATMDIVGGIGQIVSGLTSAWNLISTIQDESLTASEKTVQIIMSSGYIFSTISAGGAAAKAGLAKLAVSLKAVSTAAKAAKLSVLQLLGAILKTNVAIGTMSVPLGAVLGVVTAIGAVLGAAIYGYIKLWNKDADAAKAAAKASEEVAETTSIVQQAYQELKNSVEAYDQAVEELNNKLQKGTEEYSKALNDINDQIIELIKKHKALSKYIETNNEGMLVFNSEGRKYIEDMQLHSEQGERLNNEVWLEGQRRQYESNRTNASRTYSDTRAAGYQPYEATLSSQEWENLIQYLIKNENGIVTEETIQRAITNSSMSEFNKTLAEDIFAQSEAVAALESLIAQLQDLNDTAKVLIKNDLSGAIAEDDSTFAGLSEGEKNVIVTRYQKGWTPEQEAEARKKAEEKWNQDAPAIIGGGNEDTVHTKYAELKGWTFVEDKTGDKAYYLDQNNVQQEVRDDTARAELIAADIEKARKDYDLNQRNLLVSGVSKLSDSFVGMDQSAANELLGFFADDKEFSTESLTYTMYNDLEAALQSPDFKQKLQKLTKEEWSALGYSSADAYIKEVSAGLQKVDKDIIKQNGLKNISKVFENSMSLQQGIQSGDITYKNIKDNEDYKAVLGQLEELKSIYPEISAAANIVAQDWLVGTQLYAEALEDVQDKIYGAKIASLDSSIDEEIDDITSKMTDADGKTVITLELDTEDFDKQLNEYLEAEHKIDVAVHTEAENEFNSVISAIDDINKKAEMIGENFVVSAQDVRELNNTFPGIIQGMDKVGDGTVKLNKEVATSAINAAKTEIAADSEAAIVKLKNQATLLRQKQTSYQQIADAAKTLSELEVGNTQAEADSKAKISDALTNLESYNNELKTQAELDNNQITANSANANAEIVAKNWSSAYQSAAESSYQFAEIAIENMKAVESGQKEKLVKPGDFGVSYEGATGVSSEAQVIGDTQDLLEKPELDEETKKQWAKIAELYQSLANSTGASANDIEGMIAEIGATNVETLHKLNNIGKGDGSDKDEEEQLKDKLDIYHDINIEIQQVNNKLEELQEWEKEVFGADLIYNLRNQIHEMNKQIENYSQKLKIAEGEAETLNAKLKQTYGARFNDDGTLMNYEEMFNRELQMVKGVYEHYNNLSDDEKKKYEQTKDDAETRWEDFKETFERYDTLITEEMPEILQSQREEENKKIEAQMKKFNLEIEVRLDLTEAENDWLDFKKALLEDDDFLEKAQLDVNRLPSYYNEDNTGIVQTGTQHVADILTELQDIDENGSSQVYGTDKVKALKDLQTYYQQLMKDLEQVEKIVDDVKKSYLDMMKESQDAFKTQIETYKQISDLYNHDMKVIELIYGEKSYSELAKYYELLEENNNKQLDFQKQQVDLWKRQMDSIDPEKNKEAWETARDNWKNAVTDLNSLIESSIATLQEKYTNAIDKIFNDLNNKITKGKGLDYISEEWDLLEQNSEQFLDEINSLYGIEDIARKYQEAIDNTDNLNVQKKLKDVMEQELKSLREKDKLTEYDIERAEKKYDLTLKQIALEEAQQNKSQLRLRRDSQGNYTYQYVADADEIAKAKQELADARNELYNFDLEQYKEKLGEMYDAYEEFQEKMKEAAQINDPEERAARELLIREQYEELINGLVMQNEDIRNNLYESAFMELSALRGKELEEYTNLTQTEKDLLMNDLIPQWDSGIQHMADVFAAEGGFIPTCEEALDELKEATNNYQTDLDELEQAAGIDFSNIKDGIDKTADATKILLEDNGFLITSYETELIAIGKLVTEMDILIERYQEAAKEAQIATEQAYAYWKAANMDTANAAKNDKYNPIDDGKDSLVEDSNNSNGNSLNGSSSDSGDAAFDDSKTKDGKISQGEHMFYDGSSGEGWYHDSYGDDPTGGPYSYDFPVRVTDVVENPQKGQDYAYHIVETSGRKRTLGWVKKKALKGYDTGGYTGSWGDEGKLALLHQKELVLNAQDTANMLNAVDILRDITNTIGTTMLNRLAQVSGSANSILAGLGVDTLEQNVHIDATFPNVQSSNEIEEAFKNLTNIAAQRIYRS